MQAVGRRNVGAFNELYRRYSKRLLRYLVRMLHGDKTHAQDLLQEVWIRILEKGSRFDVERSFSTWVYCIAHNLCKNEYRRRHVRRVAGADVDLNALQISMPPDAIEQSVEQAQFRERLQQELGRMNTVRQETFLLRFQEQFSVKEISEIMDCPAGTVKSRLHYIVNELASKLSEFRPVQHEV